MSGEFIPNEVASEAVRDLEARIVGRLSPEHQKLVAAAPFPELIRSFAKETYNLWVMMCDTAEYVARANRRIDTLGAEPAPEREDYPPPPAPPLIYVP